MHQYFDRITLRTPFSARIFVGPNQLLFLRVHRDDGTPDAQLPGRLIVDVTRSGDWGSPRVVGSTSASSLLASIGCRSVRRLRPPPGRRTRPRSHSGRRPRFFSSHNPAAIVLRAIPIASATRDTPPQPIARASVAAQMRRDRSFITRDNFSYFSRISVIPVTDPYYLTWH
jgi:hypothetical protein